MSAPERIRDFLAGTGRDGSRRRLADVLAFDDGQIESVHDFVQWCFPLREASRAVPGAPVLSAAEAEAIRQDDRALGGLRAALARMRLFYGRTDAWLTGFDHNHLRITRILSAVGDLLGQEPAAEFHAFVTQRDAAAGAPINRETLGYWVRALGRG